MGFFLLCFVLGKMIYLFIYFLPPQRGTVLNCVNFLCSENIIMSSTLHISEQKYDSNFYIYIFIFLLLYLFLFQAYSFSLFYSWTMDIRVNTLGMIGLSCIASVRV